jgi:tripartite-type tricarboxylate transporter receptor subunit TctC
MRSRLKLLLTLGVAATTFTLGGTALAQSADPAWPNKPIRIIVGFAPGTAPDTFARLYGEFIGKKTGQTVTIDNRPGAAGNLAADAVAKSSSDGTTLLYNLSTGVTINPHIYSKLPYDPAKDLLPVATTMRQGLVLITQPAFAAKNPADLVAASKAKPDSISHASYGAGSPSHLIMEWFKDEAGMKMVHVPYRASPLPDVIGGQVDTALEPIATAFPMITSGKVRALAFSGPARAQNLPDVPTFAETVPGLSMMSWHGIWAPGGTPTALLERMNALFVEASRDPDVSRRIRDLQSEPLGVSRAEMAAMVQRDSEIYGRLVKAKNIRVD